MNNRVEQVPMGMPPRTALARVAFAAALGEPEQHRQHADEHRAGHHQYRAQSGLP